MAHVSEQKKKDVQEFIRLVKEYPVVGIVNMHGLPAPQVQKMREQLRDVATVKMTKKTLIRIVLKEAAKEKPGIEELSERLRGLPAFVFTKDNPFKLFKTLKQKKSQAPAKPGQEAPNDIVVPAGPTPFAPGPIIGELGSVGIKAGIENGKVAVKQDSVVVKEGEKISPELAGILTRLGIEPMEIGLDLVAVFEEGSIFGKDVLDINEQEYKDNIAHAHRWAFNLAMQAGVLTPETTEIMFINAQRDAIALALSQAIESSEVIDQLLMRASGQANALQALVK
jgi:large subunit ribosomal protein L10